MARRMVLLILAIMLLGAGFLAYRAYPAVPELPPIDRIVVDKSDRRMELYAAGRLVHTMTGVGLGDAPVGHKQFEGDEKTPEGTYRIDLRNPRSSYHLSLRISYPDDAAKQFAVGQARSPGGEIYIHGQPNWLRFGRLPGDWTDGCIAVSNREVEALWNAVGIGTRVDVRP